MTFDLENKKWTLISVTVADRANSEIWGPLPLLRVIKHKKCKPVGN